MSNPLGQGGQDALEGAKQQAEQQVGKIIDEYAGKVPGGDQAAQQAKDTANQAIENLEDEAQKRLGGLGGGLGS